MFLQTSWFLHFSNNVPFIALTVDAKSAHVPRVNQSRGNLTLNNCSHLARFWRIEEALNGLRTHLTARSRWKKWNAWRREWWKWTTVRSSTARGLPWVGYYIYALPSRTGHNGTCSLQSRWIQTKTISLPLQALFLSSKILQQLPAFHNMLNK